MRQESQKLGRIIHTYRKAQGLTLEELAEKICKSKSTMGKYEQGLISVEITVLLDIAEALGVRPQQLLAGIETSKKKKEGVSTDGFFRYFYSYEGFSHRIMRGLMVISDPEDSRSPVSLFFDTPSFDEPEKCRALYIGEQECYATLTKYILRKRGGIETPQLCFKKPLDYMGRESGLFFGISSRTQQPVALKCVISDYRLEEDELLLDQLKVSSEDIRITKKLNQFMTEPLY